MSRQEANQSAVYVFSSLWLWVMGCRQDLLLDADKQEKGRLLQVRGVQSSTGHQFPRAGMNHIVPSRPVWFIGCRSQMDLAWLLIVAGHGLL